MLLISAAVILSWLYIVLVGGDYKFTFRFFVPAFGCFLLLFQEGFRVIYSRIRRAFSGRVAMVFMVLFTVISSVNFYTSFHRAWGFSRARSKIWLEEKAIGLWLKANSAPGARLAAGSAGIIPYFSGLPTIDMTGLTDAHISKVPMEITRERLPGHEKGDGRYVFDRSPDYILFQNFTRTRKNVSLEDIEGYFRSPPKHGLPRSEEELWRLPSFHDLYVLKGIKLKSFYFNYFQKKE